ncbi:restriction endonuclease subunit S [Acidithiobacillus sp. CV18-2]|nr:restriction endonuclease subunit S [Acidithiobacillus sp. CV18-3]MBU2756909.1 restriction endonuclease subunit S [Acidithiobacillus sp. BN09-2]MBU2777993.1 restriction endonuclease subunit S [Acidithiobacillus sp. CV18-2]MBU2799620.1 restriction endonuclease subunit S [Acidithiobacillus sp. VAN18-4]
MDGIQETVRTPSYFEFRIFNGSGSRFQVGDVLLARITPCLENGKTAYIQSLPNDTGIQSAHGSTEFIVISGKTGISSSLYGYYIARSPQFREHAISHMEGTSGRQRVPANAIAAYKTWLPDIKEQLRIAHILGTLDDKIENNRKTAKTLEAMAQAIFKSWFVDFDPVRAKASGESTESICKRLKMTPEILALFPDGFEDSELGKIPRGWRVAGLDTIADFLNGLPLQRFPVLDQDCWLPAIKIAQMSKGSSEGADRVDRNIPSKYLVKNGDLLFSWSGSLQILLWTAGDGALNQHLFKVTSEDYPQWFYYFWLIEHLPSFINTAAEKATTMGHIQRYHLSAATIPVPSLELLDIIDKRVGPLLSSVIAHQIESHKLSKIRDTLLPKLISGELRVDEAEELFEEATG